MGLFRLELEATGGHGCQRNKKDGEMITNCRRTDCPDCVIEEFVVKMSSMFGGTKAKLIHWPGDPSEVVDEYVVPLPKVSSYKDSTGKECHYVDKQIPHRIRRGNF